MPQGVEHILSKMLARANPTLPDFQSVLAATLNNVGNLLFDAGRMDEALASVQACGDDRRAAGESQSH